MSSADTFYLTCIKIAEAVTEYDIKQISYVSGVTELF
jgi:hypothetical protein